MNAMIQFANGGALELESWVSQTLARSVALNLNNVQLASGGPVERAYSGAGSDVIQGAASTIAPRATATSGRLRVQAHRHR